MYMRKTVILVVNQWLDISTEGFHNFYKTLTHLNEKLTFQISAFKWNNRNIIIFRWLNLHI